jgi:hypothetical protein
MTNNNKDYLGDGVYVDNDAYHIILSTTRDGREEIIFMEMEVFCALLRYAERTWGVNISMTLEGKSDEEK